MRTGKEFLMQLIGQTVNHEVFGKGVVTGRDQQTMTVHFPEGNKMFLYPEAFSKYLVAQNRELQDLILSKYHAQEEARLAKERAELARWEKEAALRNRKIPSRSQGVFDIQPDALKDAFASWTVSTGTYLSGYSKGDPRIPDRMGPNSLCLMTVRRPGTVEAQRQIVGMFMAPEDFDGSACEDGRITAHPKYRLQLPADRSIPFWPYITSVSSKQKWGNTVFKYLPNELGEQILRDLRGSCPDSQTVRDFYDYFCTLNHLDPVPGK